MLVLSVFTRELTTDKIQEIMDKAVPETTKKATKFGMRLFDVRICYVSLTICKISNVTVEILRIYEDYIKNNNVYLNVTEWLARPVGATFQNQ